VIKRLPPLAVGAFLRCEMLDMRFETQETRDKTMEHWTYIRAKFIKEKIESLEQIRAQVIVTDFRKDDPVFMMLRTQLLTVLESYIFEKEEQFKEL
jgi:hypothetical protein